MQQEPFLFNTTIFQNVANGLIGTEWEAADPSKKKELVERACKEAFADEFISRLPEGYETRVGDAGIKLSGGQRQRLAIARAIVKMPKILILDEATSSIDVRGEKVVQAALDKVSKNRTTIMIAHRLSTVKKADNIVVLAKGKVVQWGNHETLMAQLGGPYWLLTNSQKLSMGDGDGAETASGITEEEKRTMDLMTLDETKPEVRDSESTVVDGPAYRPKGVMGSFGAMLLEQKPFWPWYAVMLFGAIVAGGKYMVNTAIGNFTNTQFRESARAGLHIRSPYLVLFFMGRRANRRYQFLVPDVRRVGGRSRGRLLCLRIHLHGCLFCASILF